ncbi:MAG: primosomal protein N' [Burkholderiales bacterium]
MLVARVAIDVPVDTLFDYLPGPATPPDIGRRVLVPFGRRQTVGVLRALVSESAVPERKLKPVTRVFTDLPPLDHSTLRLLDFCARYYHYPIGETILRALPTRLRSSRAFSSHFVKVYGFSDLGRKQALTGSGSPARATLKARVLERLATHGQVTGAALRDLGPRVSAVLRELKAAGIVDEDLVFAPDTERPRAPAEPASRPRLTAEQDHARSAVLTAGPGFRVWLLQGVTGSGKTEVYLRLMEEMLAGGKQVLYLVPEINLTPQLEGSVRRRANAARVVSLHSGLADGERARNWVIAQRGDADIVLGTRLAVFTPLPRLGLIVVDEEHDTSFKQQEGLRYSARDVAIMRAKQNDVPIVLGSATPALETYSQALSGRYGLLRLTARALGETPAIVLVDTGRERLDEGMSARALDALAQRLGRSEQTLVFINRRGYAPILHCRACHWFAGCPRCSSRLVVHLKDQRLVCHLCGHCETLPMACAVCGNQDLSAVGHGTQRVERFVGTRFPGARVLRVDRDTTRARQAWETMRTEIAGNRVDVLVGTQMLAKGHDFPGLTLVIVLNADSALFSADFRAAERMFAQLMQVAGRAGRAALAGEVLIQTEFPHHPLYQALLAQDYDGFARIQLAERRRAGFPPAAHQALLRAVASKRDVVFDFLERAAAAGRALGIPVQIYDPVAATRPRVAGLDRAQLLVQSTRRSRLQSFLDAWYPSVSALAGRGVRWALDVDPLDL